jgi:hypothetical protein
MFKKMNWMEADVNYSDVIPAFGETGKNKENLTQDGDISADFREKRFFRVP